MKENTVLDAATNLILINSSWKLYSKGCLQDDTFQNQHEGLYYYYLPKKSKLHCFLNVVHATLLHLLFTCTWNSFKFELEHRQFQKVDIKKKTFCILISGKTNLFKFFREDLSPILIDNLILIRNRFKVVKVTYTYTN